MQRTPLTRDDFIKAVKAADVPEIPVLFKGGATEVKAVDDRAGLMETDSYALDWTISTAEVDRDGDTIKVTGWDVSDWKKNPVVLWAHDHSIPAVARGLSVKKADGALVSRAAFPLREVYEFGGMIGDMVKAKILHTASVGFIPREYALVETEERFGFDFKKQSLLEWSVVNVPSNPGAVVSRAKAAGIDYAPLRDWCEKVLSGDGGPEKTDATADLWAGIGELWKAAKRPVTMVTFTRSADGSLYLPKENTAALDALKSAGIEISLDETPQIENDTARKEPDMPKILSYEDAHAKGCGVAKRDKPWTCPEPKSADDAKPLALGYSDDAGWFGLHHEAGPHKTVNFSGLVSAMESLASGDFALDAAETKAAYDHLAKHYRDDFDAAPPSENLVLCHALKNLRDHFKMDRASGQIVERAPEEVRAERAAKAVSDAVIALSTLTEKDLAALDETAAAHIAKARETLTAVKDGKPLDPIAEKADPESQLKESIASAVNAALGKVD